VLVAITTSKSWLWCTHRKTIIKAQSKHDVPYDLARRLSLMRFRRTRLCDDSDVYGALTQQLMTVGAGFKTPRRRCNISPCVGLFLAHHTRSPPDRSVIRHRLWPPWEKTTLADSTRNDAAARRRDSEIASASTAPHTCRVHCPHPTGMLTFIRKVGSTECKK